MYKIGEFSKLTNITIKALRFYDEQGLLKPSQRSDNNYRFYSEKDFEKAQLITLLKNLDFTIAEIKDTLNNCDSKEDLHYYLSEKKEFIINNMRKEYALIRELDRHLNVIIKEDNNLDYTIEIKKLEPVNVASIRFKGSYKDVGKYIGAIYKAVKGKAGGTPFNLYYDDEYKEIADIELCVPTKALVQSREVSSKQLPAIKAICTTHKGSYQTLNLAYKAIFDFAKEKGYECKLPSREIYIKGPGMIFKGNPEKYITEIVIPIE
jgi:DNA-binding transcriptional MerR regulator